MESTAAASAAAGSTSSSTTAAPPKPEVRSWADEADEEDEKAAPPSDDKAEEVKRLEALRIKEEEADKETKAGRGEGLDEPEDSAISAVSTWDQAVPPLLLCLLSSRVSSTNWGFWGSTKRKGFLIDCYTGVRRDPRIKLDGGVRKGSTFLSSSCASMELQVTTGETVYTSAVSFEDLKLSKELIQGLYVEMGFKRPSKIQAVSLPMILTPPCKNLVAQAHNGSGKTTCFVLGMLSRVDPQKKLPQALCICPTRELAQQVRLRILSTFYVSPCNCLQERRAVLLPRH